MCDQRPHWETDAFTSAAPPPRRVALYSPMRLASQRVPRKMLAAIYPDGVRLVDLALSKMQQVRRFNVTPICGICWTDRELLEPVARAGIEVLLLDECARDGETVEDEYHQLPERFGGRFDWVAMVNFCHPFLRLETLRRVADAAKYADSPRVFTVQRRGLVFDAAGRPLIGEGQAADTKTNPHYHVLAHVGYAAPVRCWASAAALHTGLQPHALPLEPAELLDIDTPDELELCRHVARGLARDPERRAPLPLIHYPY